MLKRGILWLGAMAAAVVLLAVPQAEAAKYPIKPIKVILATGAGGSHDKKRESEMAGRLVRGGSVVQRPRRLEPHT